MAKERSGFAVGSAARVVHVNLRELSLPTMGRLRPEHFEFPQASLDALKRHLSQRAINELRRFARDALFRAHIAGEPAANSAPAVKRQVMAVANLTDALATVLERLGEGLGGNFLNSPEFFWDKGVDRIETNRACMGSSALELALRRFCWRTLKMIESADAADADLVQRPGGRPPSTPADLVAGIAAIVAWHRVPLGQGADTPFFQICEAIWGAMGMKTKPSHAISVFFQALKGGKLRFRVLAPSRVNWRRVYLFESAPGAAKGYRVTVVKDYLTLMESDLRS